MDPTEDFPISGYVRQSRRRAATNQRELAELAGITQSTLSRIEAGRSIPNVATLLRLLRVGGMHLAVVTTGAAGCRRCRSHPRHGTSPAVASPLISA